MNDPSGFHTAPVRPVVRNANGFKKTLDPQMILEGTYRQGEASDMIVFRFKLFLVEITCIVTVPPDGETHAPVYLKFKLDKSMNMPPGSVKIGNRNPRPAPEVDEG